jgi:hypothetical protein
MTTLEIPSLERRLLQTVTDEVVAKPVNRWPERSLQLGLDVLRRIRESAADMHKALEEDLADGAEARSFVQEYGQYLPAAIEHLKIVRELADSLAPAADPGSNSLAAELRLLEQENLAFRDFLAEALFLASKPPGPVDWECLTQISHVDFAAGRFARYTTSEEMLNGLARVK